MVTNRLLICLLIGFLAMGAMTAVAQDSAEADVEAAQREKFRSLDEDVQSLKKEVLDLNRDLFLLEEELLFPANSQVAFFILGCQSRSWRTARRPRAAAPWGRRGTWPWRGDGTARGIGGAPRGAGRCASRAHG